MKQFREIAQKGQGELFVFSRYLYRPFTAYISRLYLLLGLSPTAATIHSVLAALAGAAALLRPSPVAYLLGALGLQVYFILDYVDGEVARVEVWRGTREPTADGEYIDFWAHFHSVNLVFGALGVGMAMASGQVIWAVLGLLADNCLGNFPKFTLVRTLCSLYQREPSIVTRPMFPVVLGTVTDSTARELFQGRLNLRAKLFLVAREMLFFPGCLIALSVTLVIDAVTALASGSFDSDATQVYLVIFVVVSVASKIRRTIISARQLRSLTQGQ
jgi:phosphatidylglycerophosphate synthase